MRPGRADLLPDWDCQGSQIIALRPEWRRLHADPCRRRRACQDSEELFVPVGQVDRGENVCARRCS